MAQYAYWTHGVDGQIEWPNMVLDGGQGTPVGHPRRAGFGLCVRQNAGTTNWFHFAIPTPTKLHDDASIWLKNIHLRIEVNENAMVDSVHLWDGGSRFQTWDNLSLVGQSIDQDFDNPDHNTSSGIVVCVLVKFLDGNETGQVTFVSAGGRYHS